MRVAAFWYFRMICSYPWCFFRKEQPFHARWIATALLILRRHTSERILILPYWLGGTLRRLELQKNTPLTRVLSSQQLPSMRINCALSSCLTSSILRSCSCIFYRCCLLAWNLPKTAFILTYSADGFLNLITLSIFSRGFSQEATVKRLVLMILMNQSLWDGRGEYIQCRWQNMLGEIYSDYEQNNLTKGYIQSVRAASPSLCTYTALDYFNYSQPQRSCRAQQLPLSTEQNLIQCSSTSLRLKTSALAARASSLKRCSICVRLILQFGQRRKLLRFSARMRASFLSPPELLLQALKQRSSVKQYYFASTNYRLTFSRKIHPRQHFWILMTGLRSSYFLRRRRKVTQKSCMYSSSVEQLLARLVRRDDMSVEGEWLGARGISYPLFSSSTIMLRSNAIALVLLAAKCRARKACLLPQKVIHTTLWASADSCPGRWKMATKWSKVRWLSWRKMILRERRWPRQGKAARLLLERSSFTRFRHWEREEMSMLKGVCRINSFSDSCSGISSFSDTAPPFAATMFIITIQLDYITFMKAELHQRPQSRRIKLSSGKGGQKGSQEKAEDYFRKGKSEQGSGNFDKAIDCYIRAVGYSPDYFQAYCNMGYCYRALGKYPQAKRCYMSSLAINRNDPISHYNLANLYRINGQNELAIPEYEFIINRTENGEIPTSSLYLNSLINVGICFKNEGEVEEAITIYRKVLTIDPNEKDAIFNLAVCLLNSIESKNSAAFHKFYEERASEAQALFRSIEDNNSNALMIKLSLAKISVFFDTTTANINKNIELLREMLLRPECDIKDEVNQLIAHCLKLSKQFEQSSKLYEGSISNLSRRKSMQAKRVEEAPKIDNIFENFEPDRPLNYGDEAFLTEAEGIRLIEDGELQLAEQRIGELSDHLLLKHSLKLILCLKQAEQDEQYVHQAFKIYTAHFDKNEEELPFNRLSLETHKALGKILSLSNRFEESIKHYEYISDNLVDRRVCTSAKLYTELGQGFEETGNIKKALEEYRRAVEIEPDNYTLTYNMGSCYYESGNYQEAVQQFENILSKIDKDSSFNPQTKELYRTDCMILLALASQDKPAKLKAVTAALAQLQLLKAHQQTHLQMLQDNLLHFLIQACELYEQQILSISKADPLFSQAANTLLAAYSALLQLENCPDSNQIIVNSGNIYYQLQRYASAAHAYEQASRSQLVPKINHALAYAHIIEPMAAMRHIHLACAEKKKDLSSLFCRQVLEWVYYRERGGEWSSFLPNIKWDMYYERQEYGLALIDKLTQIINEPSFDATNLNDILHRLVKESASFAFKQPHKNIKFEKVQSIITNYDIKSELSYSNILTPPILKICFSKSQNIEQDFKKLAGLLKTLQSTGKEGEFCETALYLLIYYNQGEFQKILQQMEKYSKRKTQHAIIESSTKDNDIYSIFADFKNIKQLVATIKEWETILQEKVISIADIIQKHYYSGNILRPLQFDYNFPRHSNLLESDETLEKVMYIAKEALKYSHPLSFRGQNVEEMRQDMIKQFQNNFGQFLQKGKPQPITLSTSFLPLTIHSVHQSKADCQIFLDKLTAATMSPPIKIGDCEEFVLVLDKLVKVKCRWSNPYEIGYIIDEVLESMIESPIFIVNQAIIYLEKIRNTLSNDSPEAKHYVSLDSTLHF